MPRKHRRALRFHGLAPRIRPSAHVVVAGAGVLAIGAGTAIAAQAGAFYYHSATAGRDLVGQERRAIAKAAVSPLPARDGDLGSVDQ
jgi:hypothetical protein